MSPNSGGCKHEQTSNRPCMLYKVSCLQEGEGEWGKCHYVRGPHPDIQSPANLKTDPTPFRISAPGEHLTASVSVPCNIICQFETIRASARELYIWGYCLAMFVIIFGTVIYYAERWESERSMSVMSLLRMLEDNPRNHFISIPHSMWWAVVTMCTVGRSAHWSLVNYFLFSWKHFLPGAQIFSVWDKKARCYSSTWI